MDKTTSMMLLIVALFFNSVSAFPADDSKHLKFQTPSKYASPQLYVFGGYDGTKDRAARYLSSVSQFNSSSGEWERTTAMSGPRSQFCGAVVGTKIYLFGGEHQDVLSETAEIYDCETGTYTQFRSMPTPRSGCGAAALGDFVYVAGGFTNLPVASNLDSVLRFNVHTTHREKVASMNKERQGHQLVELGGRLYAIGGGSNTAEVYDSSKNQWTMVAGPKNAHKNFGAAAHEGKIYVYSDLDFGVYSPDTDKWETLAQPENYNFEGRSLVSMNGKLWAVGGDLWSKRDGSKAVHTYDASTKKWTELPEMDTKRTFTTAFVVNHA